MTATTTEAGVVDAAADFGTRFSAFMIDTTLLFAGQWIVFIVLSRQLQAAGMTSLDPCPGDPARLCEGPSTVLWAILLLVLAVTTIGYPAFFEGRYGATPGKRWAGLQVTMLDGTTPIGAANATLRAIVRQAFWLSLFFLLDASPLALPVPSVLFVLIPLLAIGGVAYGAVSTGGRAAHDLAAGTVVVRADRVRSKTTRLSSVAPESDEPKGDT